MLMYTGLKSLQEHMLKELSSEDDSEWYALCVEPFKKTRYFKNRADFEKYLTYTSWSS